MQTVDFNILDELYLNLNRKEEPWSVHLEIRVEGTLDGARLADAIVAGARRHPLARAHLVPVRPTDVRYRWEIADDLQEAPLEVVECGGDTDLAAARERLMSTSLPLDRPPPFAVTLAHHPEGDAVLLNLSHAAADGISAVRLLTSILRAYSGEADKSAPVDALAVRDIRQLVNSDSLSARIARRYGHLEHVARFADSPARIAARDATGRAGYGFDLQVIDGQGLERIRNHRALGSTVNDVLLAALAVTIRKWNEHEGGDPGTVSLMMPMNLRPEPWRTEVVGNFASYVSVKLGEADQRDLSSAVVAATDVTSRLKDHGAAGVMVDLLELPTAMLPAAFKRHLHDFITLTDSRLVDTAVLSNLGRLVDIGRLDRQAGRLRQVWFSPPGRMPLGASLGAATYGDELFLCLRYRNALFDGAAAADFMTHLRDVLEVPVADKTGVA